MVVGSDDAGSAESKSARRISEAQGIGRGTTPPTCPRMAQSDDLHTVLIRDGITDSSWQHTHLPKVANRRTIHGQMCELELKLGWSWAVGTEACRCGWSAEKTVIQAVGKTVRVCVF